MIHIPHKPEKYEDFKDRTFKKYEKKINSVIKNIDMNSLSKYDKQELKNRLAEKILNNA